MINLRRYDPEQLEVLSRTSPDELGRAIAETISTLTGEFWKDFIRFTQHLQVTDPEVRVLLSKALFHSARVLRDRDLAAEEETLWAAIRMAAVFATKPEGLAPLTGFLGDRYSSGIHRVSLQAISNVATRGPLPNAPELRDLASLVEFSANHFCDSYLLVLPPVASIAIDSVVAARALGMQEIERWRSEFRKHPLLLRQLDNALSELTSDWPEGAQKVAAAPVTDHNRAAVLVWLAKAPERQMAELEKDGGYILLEWICSELKAQDRRLEATIGVLAHARADADVRDRLAYQWSLEEAQRLAAKTPGPEETPGQARRRARRVEAADPGPRQRPRLVIGQEFTHPSTGHRWRVTDVGTRTFLAVDLTKVEQSHPGDTSWLNGPPYAVVESPWDEYDAMALQAVPGIEWEDALKDPCPAPHLHSGGYRENRYPCDFCGKVPDMTGKCTVCRGRGTVMGDCGDSPNVWYDTCEACKGSGNAPVDGVAPQPPTPLEVLLSKARQFTYDWKAQEGSSMLDELAAAVVAHDEAEAAQRGNRKP